MAAKSEDQQPITVGSVLKYGTIVVAIVSTLVGCVWTAASYKGEVTTTSKLNDITNARQDSDIAMLKAQREENERWKNDITIKLDRLINGSDRLEKKIDQHMDKEPK